MSRRHNVTEIFADYRVHGSEDKSMVGFREATDNDLEAVLELYADPHLDNGERLSLDEARDTLRRLRSYPNYRLYVGELGEELVATFVLLIMDNLAHCGKPSGVMEAVVVEAKRRGQGIGRAAVAFALRRCHEAGCYKLALSSNKKRTEAHRFYESLGFERHGYSFSTSLTESSHEC